MDESLEAQWSRLVEPEPALGATIRPAEHAPTLAAWEQASEGEPLPLGVVLRGDGAAGRDLEVKGTLGQGGMSSVLLARQRSLRRDVAVKAALPGDARSAAAILSEGVITGSLEHPAIVPVHLLGVDDTGCPAIVMKRIVGVTWLTLIAEPAHEGWEGWGGNADDRLPGHLQILTAICNALAFAHSRGVVHRDVKPSNVLIGRYGDVYLADWGIATRVGASGEALCGTPGYLAPEMATGGTVDERTDVYLLGACLHEVLTGEPRHDAPNAMAAIARSMESAPFDYADEAPFELAALANRSCHLAPDERPADALAFRAALGDYGRHRESVALAREASNRLDALAALTATELDDASRTERDHLQAQASFALERALGAWPDNPRAREENARLEAHLAARRAREAELASAAADRDHTAGGAQRALGLGGFALLVVVLTAYSAWPGRPLQNVAVESWLYPAMLWLWTVVLAVVARRQGMKNRFNRDATATLVFIFSFVVVERVVGVFAQMPEWVNHTLELTFLSAAAGVYGITQRRWALVPAAIALVGAMGCALFPEQRLFWFGVLAPVSAVVAGALAWRDRG